MLRRGNHWEYGQGVTGTLLAWKYDQRKQRLSYGGVSDMEQIRLSQCIKERSLYLCYIHLIMI